MLCGRLLATFVATVLGRKTMTDKAKPLIERLRKARVWPDYSQSRVTIETAHQAADLIETQAREIERLREWVEAHTRKLNYVFDRLKWMADWGDGEESRSAAYLLLSYLTGDDK